MALMGACFSARAFSLSLAPIPPLWSSPFVMLKRPVNRFITLPRTHLFSSDEVLARTSNDLRPSHLVEALLSWAPRIVRHGSTQQPVPVIFHPEYGFSDWDDKHRFVMAKFHGVMKQIEQLQLKPALSQAFSVESDFAPISRAILERVHDSHFVEAFCSGTLDNKALRRIGLPWSPQLVRRTLLECEGTRQTVPLALRRHALELHSTRYIYKCLLFARFHLGESIAEPSRSKDFLLVSPFLSITVTN